MLVENFRQGMIISARSVLIILASTYFVWLLWNLFYAIPSVDDFCYGYGGHIHGVFGNVAVIYKEWSGRYLATFIITLFAYFEHVLLNYYYLVPLSILLLNMYAIRYFLHAFSEKRVIVWLGVFALLMAFFQVRQSLYWLSGGATYGLACRIFLLLMAEEFKVFAGKVPLTASRIAAIILGTILLAGSNEGAALGHLALLGPLALMHYAYTKEKRVFYLLLGAVVGVLIAGLAPGNFARLSVMHEHIGFLSASWNALILIGKRYFLLLGVLVVMLYILMRLFPVSSRQNLTSASQSLSTPHVIAFTVCIFFALWAGAFVRVYIMGDLGPSRTRTQDFMLVILIAFGIASYINAKRTVSKDEQRPISLSMVLGMKVIIILSTWLLSAFTLYPYQSWRQLITITKSSAELHQFMKVRFSQVSNAKGKALEVPEYPVKKLMPITFFSDITYDEKKWENICFSSYFGMKSIVKTPL